MIRVQVKDSFGSGNGQKINGEGETPVVVHPHPPRDEEVEAFPFRQYFTDDGGTTGDNNMIVNATASASQDFYITASTEYDLYIKTLAVQITDGGATLEKFGALNALANGVKWIWFTNELGEYEMHDGITTNLEFVKTALGQPAFGAGTTAFRADLKGGSSDDTFLPVIDCTSTFGLPWGIRLKKGSKDKLIFRVQDNLTGMAVFNIIGYGIRF